MEPRFVDRVIRVSDDQQARIEKNLLGFALRIFIFIKPLVYNLHMLVGSTPSDTSLRTISYFSYFPQNDVASALNHMLEYTPGRFAHIDS